ncbi:tyrosine-type recombinase/integrase [Pseudomonas coleopterorum]|uniref:tyrosine-type recombinase/integrase n=1 Tax=Pseudomonas coleopterorum TaxID=1605838 RepID=UPI0028B1A165|nr:site-specific integrase [Pseudomonas coleopterorum]
MAIQPQPLFDTYANFLALNFNGLSAESPIVLDFLASFDPAVCAEDGYLAARAFLKSYAGNERTFNSYRTQVERLLLWSVIVRRRPLLDLTRVDAEAYMEFCLNPPTSWIGPVIRGRFLESQSGSDAPDRAVNPNWRPFCVSVPKRVKKVADETGTEVGLPPFVMSQGSTAQAFVSCSSFFEFSIAEGMSEFNPFRAIRQKSHYRQRSPAESTSKALTPLQWDYVLETAEKMADEEPETHERTLFITATMFSMYLRVSDLVGRPNWKPCMGDFRKDSHGNWWFYVVGKGNKSAKIGVRDDYIDQYLVRYRKHLKLPSLPSPGDTTPLLASFKGRAGLSDRHVRLLMQGVFDNTLARMVEAGWDDLEVDNLRVASTHWLRHTSATFDAPLRTPKDLQTDMRHSSLATTQDVYYNTHDDKRAYSVKRLGMKDRG